MNITQKVTTLKECTPISKAFVIFPIAVGLQCTAYVVLVMAMVIVCSFSYTFILCQSFGIKARLI